MANTVSAIKRVRQTERRTVVNRLRKSRMRTEIKKMRKLLQGGDVKAVTAAVPGTFSMIDRAAKWGVIKKNTAARYKARISARLHKLDSPAAA